MAIDSGLVTVRGVASPKPASMVEPDVHIELVRDARAYVSRGGDKLDGALRDLGISVSGRRWLDAGSSTGGFTDRLLQGGAVAVIAVDVGYGQLDWSLRNDERVVVLERTNVRHLTAEHLPWSPEAVVADLSFISLRTVLPALRAVATVEAEFLLMVKPQFEVGKGSVGKGGVVRDPELWAGAVRSVVEAGEKLGLGLRGTAVSRVPGPSGNREFFVHLVPGHDSVMRTIDEAIERAAER